MVFEKNIKHGLISFALLLGLPSGAKAQLAPDLTSPGVIAGINTTYNYSLGPTGMRGWLYRDGRNVGDYGLMTAQKPWQILVVAVGANTPAYGIMASNDVILGVSTGLGNLPVPLFTNDARKCLGWAIGAAEAGDGAMNLKQWRAGVTNEVTIHLQFLNLAYSATAPYNCPKSALILSNACNIIAQESFPSGAENGYPGPPVLGLALMASGNTNYLPQVKAYAYSVAPATLAITYAFGQNTSGADAWGWGYNGVFLAEYYLLTGDTNVIHGIGQYTLALAQAQSRYGTLAHGGSLLNTDGSFHGTMGPYGPVNSGGLVANLAIVLGSKCLVQSGSAVDPEISSAIARADNFFSFYVNKGSIPYGEHQPGCGGLGGQHSSNGKDSMAALLFALQGNQPVATEYFTRMTLAGYNGREYGHTGQGFSYLWSAMAANIGGTNAMASYFSQIRWHLDLERRCDGSFVYDGGDQYGGSALYDYWGTANYYGIDPTATYVLTYALPIQALYLTGKNAYPANSLSSVKVTNAIWAGNFGLACGNYNTNQLLSALAEYDPQVRWWAATTIASNTNTSFSMLTNLLASTNTSQRAAACIALGSGLMAAKTNSAPLLARALSDADDWVRAQAANALRGLGSAAIPQLTNMLMAFTNNATDANAVVWTDPVQIANGYLSFELFGDSVYGGNNVASSTINASTNLLYPALRAGLKQPDSNPRYGVAQFAQNKLTLPQVKTLSPEVFQIAASESQADTMWSMNPRDCGITTLANYRVAEALPLALSMLVTPKGFGWNNSVFLIAALKAMTNYGDSARWTLPTLRGYLSTWDPTSSQYTALNSAIASINSAISTPSGITNLYPVANSQLVVTTNAVAVTLTGFSWRTSNVGFTNVTAPSHGVLTGTAPNLTYTPSSNYAGVDNFSFQVFDSVTNSPSAGTVNLIVSMAPGSGLTGAYYTNVDFTGLKFTRTDTSVNFSWGASPPTNTMSATNYSVRWTGLLLAPESANYVFSTLNSDGVNLYVNGVPVINDWVNQSLQWTDGAPVALTAGRQYVVQMDYFEKTGNAVAKLKWTGPSFAGSNGLIIAPQWLYNGAGVTNWPAIAYPQSVTMVQNTNLAITLTGTGNNSTYAIATPPTHGTLSGTPPYVTYTPATNYNGSDSFIFVVNNGLSNSAPATVSIAIWAGLPISYFWKSAVSGNWSDAANWTNAAGVSVAPAVTGQPYYTLNFNPSGTYTVTNDLTNAFILNQLNVAGTVTFGGTNAVAFVNNGPLLPQINQNSANGIFFYNPLKLSALTALGGTGGGQVTLSNVLFGTGGLVLNQGLLQMNWITNTYAGGTIINGGTASVGGVFNSTSPNYNASFGSGPVTMNNHATLLLQRVIATNALVLNGGTIMSENGFNATWKGPVTLNSNATVQADFNMTFSGNLTGVGGLILTGTRTMNLNGINSYSGGTYVTSGILACSVPAALGGGILQISSSGVAALNYTGTRWISALFLSGINSNTNSTSQPYGAYGATGSGATFIDDADFTGTGTVTVAPLTGLTNSSATGITSNSAVLNTTLCGFGTNYSVHACWNTVNGGTSITLWTNSAFVGTWTNVPIVNVSYSATGLAPNKTYYFTCRATNSAGSIWATNVQSFTTLAPLTVPDFGGGGIALPGGVPSFTFSTVAGYIYRLTHKTALTDATWVPVIAPPNFPPPNGWSAAATGSTMSLSDTNTVGQPQRFYRIEVANP